jgi:hypothetical protein
MPTYKQPSKVASPEAGPAKVRETLRANVTIANRRSNAYDGVKTSGIKVRGTGAATKGLMARGPMA